MAASNVTEAARESRVVLCRVGLRLCAVPIEHAVETLRPLPIQPLANVPGFVAGVAIIRGEPVPVLELGVLLGDAARPPIARFLVVRSGERRAALAVESVVGVERLERDALGALPPLLARAGDELISAIGTHDRELLLLLESARLVPEAVWRELDRSRASAS